MNASPEKFEWLSEIIRKRRAIFPVQYSTSDIPGDIVDQLIELANWAPTHRRTEPWRYVVVSGNGRERLGKFLANTYRVITPDEKFNPIKQKKILNKCIKSQYVLIVLMQRDPMERVPEWEEIAAVAMSVQNIWLGCSALGLGAYWSTPGLKDYISEWIPLSEGERCLGFFYIGSFDDSWPTGHREPISDKVRYVAS